MQMTDCIKLPWYIYHSERDGQDYGIFEVDGKIVGIINASGIRANAELVVQSVNAHDKLVSALKHMLDTWKHWVVFVDGKPVGSLSEEYIEALEALHIARAEVRVDND